MQWARPAAELPVQRGQPCLERRGVGGVVGRVLRVDGAQPVRDGLGDGGVAHRVEPEVRVGRALPVGMLLPGLDRGEREVQLRGGGHVETAVRGLRGDRLVDGRLQALLEHHDRGLADAGHVPRRQLEVVRLRARLGEVGDTDVRAADLLGGQLQRVERRHDGQRAGALRPAVGGAAPGERDRGGGEGGREPCGQEPGERHTGSLASDENDCQNPSHLPRGQGRGKSWTTARAAASSTTAPRISRSAPVRRGQDR